MYSKLRYEDLKEGALALDYCRIIAKIRDMLPSEKVWTNQISNFSSIHEPFAVSKLLEIVYERLHRSIKDFFKQNTSISIGSEKYDITLNNSSSDFDSRGSGGNLISNGEDLTFFLCECTRGLCENECLQTCVTFEYSSFTAYADCENFNHVDTSKPCPYLRVTIGDLLEKDEELYDRKEMLDVEGLLKETLDYSESEMMFVLIKNELIHAFKVWNKPLNDELIMLCDEAIHRLYSYNLTSYLCIRPMSFETNKAMYVAYQFGLDECMCMSVDARFRLPHFFLNALIIDMALQALNQKYGFYKS